MTGAGIYVRNQPSGWKLCGVHVADFVQEGFSIGCLFNKAIFAQKFEPEVLDKSMSLTIEIPKAEPEKKVKKKKTAIL